MMENPMKTTRRQFFGLASISAAGLVLSLPCFATGGPIVVERNGTLAQALQESGRAILAQWPIDGVPLWYVASFDGETLPICRSDHAFSITHNGKFVVEPLSQRQVKVGDEISVTITRC